jgi:uncharacterized damage-inducible protein DinB
MNAELQNLIDQYAAGADALAQAIAGLSREQLQAFPVPGTWSIQQIVVHMMDSDLVLADRMKRIIAEDLPLLVEFDETRFAERLHYQSQDAALACEVFRHNRLLMHEILKRLTDEDFERCGIHTERGKASLAEWLTITVNHLEHHLKFLRDKRRLLDKS